MKKIFLLVLICLRLQTGASGQGNFVKMEFLVNDKAVVLDNNFKAYFIFNKDTIPSIVKGDSMSIPAEVFNKPLIPFIFKYKHYCLAFKYGIYAGFDPRWPVWKISFYHWPFRKNNKALYGVKRWHGIRPLVSFYYLDKNGATITNVSRYGLWLNPKMQQRQRISCKPKKVKIVFQNTEKEKGRTTKCYINIPRCYLFSGSFGYSEHHVFTYSDSSVIYLTNMPDKSITNSPNIARLNYPDSVFDQESFVLEGLQPNGNYWKEVKRNGFIVGYSNVPPDKKAAFDCYVASARLARCQRKKPKKNRDDF